MREGGSPSGLNFKKSNIRIWIHQRNMANLQQVVWEGHGQKLLVEHSNNPKMRKFLEAVPYIMGVVKDVHCDVQNGDLDSLKNRISPSVPIAVITAKDSNGLTPLHKAVGLGKDEIAKYIIEQVPSSVSVVDNEGRTPLHYAALLKDDQKMFNYLIDNGADESTLDSRQKTAAYYKTRASELDSKLLHVIPDCPRGAKEPNSFDWSTLTSATAPLPINGVIKKSIEKIENGLKEKLNLHDTSEVKEEKESQSARKLNGHLSGRKESEEDHEKSIEGETDANEEEVHHDEPNEEEKEEEPTEVKEEDQDEPETQEEASNPVENEPKEEDNNDEQQQQEEENNNEPESKDEEPELDKDSRTSSANKSRPESQASAGTRPGTATKQPDKETEEETNKKQEEETELEGEGVIEGVVNGEHEAESLNKEGPKRPGSNDNDIKTMIDSGNMEQLAALVLNGDGEKLIGEKSDNQELQIFLDNVPVYMSKINRIHVAARAGILRDLQAALDRRKFAVARDNISPNGATPLHVAIAFGRTSVVRYLAGRFPETVHVEDDNGRTPLHYAAVLRDNGHYYNLLMHLGADNRIKDKFGHTAEYYVKHQSEFNHRQILLDFGAEEEAEEILNDKVLDDLYSARKSLDDEDMIAVLDKCYTVLHGRKNSHSISAVSVNSASSGVSNNQKSSAILSNQLKRYLFDNVKLRLTKLDHNLYDIIWPSVKKLPTIPSIRQALEEDFPLGIVAPDFYIYKVFGEFLNPIIKQYNYIDTSREFVQQPSTEFFQKDNEIDLDLDPHGKLVISATLECTRNVKNYELPKSLAPSELETVERLITNALLNDRTARALYPNASEDEIKENGSGIYYTMNEVLEDPSEARVVLASNNLLIPLWNIPESDRLHGKHWPYGRGVFINNGCNLAVYVNVLDHIRIITCTSHSTPGTMGLIYSRLCRLMPILQESLEFVFDEKLGYLSSRPTTLGCGLHFNMTLKCPNLLKEPDNLRSLCCVRGLTYQKNSSAAEVFKLGNCITVGVTEFQCFEDFTTAVANILQLEKDMSMTNSLHIAAMFLNIFKKRKSASVSSGE